MDLRPERSPALLAFHHDQGGQIAFVIIPALIGFFILAALAFDAGVWYFDHRTAQNQVDAASLAAIQELPLDNTISAEAAVIAWLKRNGVDENVADAIDVVHRDDSVLTPECIEPQLDPGQARVVFGRSSAVDVGEYDMVRVCLRRDSPVLLSSLAGITEAVVSAGGTAAVELIPVPYALMAMDPTGCGTLNVHGTGTTVELLDDGKSYTASAGPCGGNNRPLRVDGSGAEFSAAGHDVCSPPPGGNGKLNGPVSQLCGLPDPWADVDPPTSAASCQNPNISSGTLGPGTYCDLMINRNLVLTGGEYIFWGDVRMTGGGGGFQVTTAGETIIYMTCGRNPCNGSTAGRFRINVSGNPALSMQGHSAYENIALYVDRTANDNDCISIQGQGDVFINGNIYAFSCMVSMSGGGNADFDLNGTIVGNELDFGGGAQYNVTWNAEFAPKLPNYALVE